MEYLRTDFQGMPLVIRDLDALDVPALVAYWHDSDPAYLHSIGVDLTKLTSREDTRQRFLSMTSPPAAERSRLTLVVATGGRPLAYSNLNLKSPREAHAHGHVLDPELRNRGFASSLFPSLLAIVFGPLGIETLTFETSPGNQAINRLIQRFGFSPRRVRLAHPDGMSRPGELNVYVITKADLSRFAARAPDSP